MKCLLEQHLSFQFSQQHFTGGLYEVAAIGLTTKKSLIATIACVNANQASIWVHFVIPCWQLDVKYKHLDQRTHK